MSPESRGVDYTGHQNQRTVGRLSGLAGPTAKGQRQAWEGPPPRRRAPPWWHDGGPTCGKGWAGWARALLPTALRTEGPGREVPKPAGPPRGGPGPSEDGEGAEVWAGEGGETRGLRRASGLRAAAPRLHTWPSPPGLSRLLCPGLPRPVSCQAPSPPACLAPSPPARLELHSLQLCSEYAAPWPHIQSHSAPSATFRARVSHHLLSARVPVPIPARPMRPSVRL